MRYSSEKMLHKIRLEVSRHASVHFDLDSSLPELGQVPVELWVVHHHHGRARHLHGVREEVALLLGLSSWGSEGPVVDGVERGGRRLGHLAPQLLQGLQAVDLGLVLHPLLPEQQKVSEINEMRGEEQEQEQ